MRLDPLNANVFRIAVIVNFAARDFAAARRAARTALSYNSEISTVYRLLGDMNLVEGNAEAALADYRKEPGEISRLRGLAIANYILEDADASDAAFMELIETYGENSLYQQAQVFAQKGQADQAIEALNRGIDAGDSGVVLTKTDPLLDPIRQDVQFGAILERLGVN